MPNDINNFLIEKSIIVKAAPPKIWNALTNAELTKKYMYGNEVSLIGKQEVLLLWNETLPLWKKNLAWDSGLDLHTESATEFSIGHFVNTDKEVDIIMERSKKAGAKIIKRAQKTFWGGYAGYFKDLNGHLWEIGHNPGWKVDE